MYVLEIVINASQTEQQLNRFRGIFPALDLVAQTQHFAILGCFLESSLTPEQTVALSEASMSRSLQFCDGPREQEGAVRNASIGYPQ